MPGFDEARRVVLDRIAPVGLEAVSIVTAAGRVLGVSERAPWDMPQWDNSAMDGFAVRCVDLADAPDGLPVVGFLPAGQEAQPLAEHTAVRIMTGAPLPPGADAVLPFEDAVEQNGRVAAKRVLEPWENVRRRGGDIRAGDEVVTAGTLIGAVEIAVLASLGRADVTVFRRPRVAILSTGDELLGLGEPPVPGRIYDSNGPALAASAIRAGAVPTLLPIARDDPEVLHDRIVEGLRADLLVTTAGVSVGDRDFVREALEKVGAKSEFWKVDIQPGRPTAFAVHGTTPVFSLPGNPVAAMLTFELFVRPAIRAMSGHRDPYGPRLRVRLAAETPRRTDRLTLMRARLVRDGGGLVATSSGRQATGFVRTLLNADAVALLPPGDGPVPEGTVVDAYPLRDAPGLGE